MKTASLVAMLILLIFTAINCAEKTSQSGGEIVFAEIKEAKYDKNNTLLWLKIKDKYTFGIPLDKVHLVYSTQDKKQTPFGTLYYNRTANVYQIDIEMPTLKDLQSWEQAFNKNEPAILYLKF